MAQSMATIGLGYAAGSALGGLASAGGPTLVLALILLCVLVQMICAWQLPAGGPPAGPARPTGAAQTASVPAAANGRSSRLPGWLVALRVAMEDPGTRTLLLLQVLSSASFQVYHSTSAIYLKHDLGYTPAQLGYLLAYAGWVYALQTFAVVPQLLRRTNWKGPLSISVAE